VVKAGPGHEIFSKSRFVQFGAKIGQDAAPLVAKTAWKSGRMTVASRKNMRMRKGGER